MNDLKKKYSNSAEEKWLTEKQSTNTVRALKKAQEEYAELLEDLEQVLVDLDEVVVEWNAAIRDKEAAISHLEELRNGWARDIQGARYEKKKVVQNYDAAVHILEKLVQELKKAIENIENEHDDISQVLEDITKKRNKAITVIKALET